MIYAEEESFSRQIDLLEYLYSIDDFDVIMWLYPESKVTVCDLKLAPENLSEGEQITVYHDGTIPNKTSRTKLTKGLLSKIRDSEKIIAENFDSIVLYSPNSSKWEACSIGHEGMVLVQDVSILDKLKSADFNVITIDSSEPALTGSRFAHSRRYKSVGHHENGG